MSALGQKRTRAPQKGMSALPPIATTKADVEGGICTAVANAHEHRRTNYFVAITLR